MLGFLLVKAQFGGTSAHDTSSVERSTGDIQSRQAYAETSDAANDLITNSPVHASKPVSEDMTLGEFRKKYLNQRIIILKGTEIGAFHVGDVNKPGSLGGWQPMKQDPDGSFQNDFSKGAFIDFRYKDQTPTVVAIRQSTVGGSVSSKAGQENAMGETVKDDDVVNPYVDVFARFDDGQLAKYTNYINSIEPRFPIRYGASPFSWDKEFILVSVRDAHAEIIARELQNAIGQKVYAVHESLLFGLDITAADLMDLGSRLTGQIRDVPLLDEMTVVGAKYNERYDFIVWKLRFPSGREVISAARYRDEDVSPNGNDNSFLGRSIGTLLAKLPAGLTSREISAIREREIFRGMSRKAVFFSWGYPSKENNYGSGGLQLVYGEHQFVYLDAAGNVTDWQSLN